MTTRNHQEPEPMNRWTKTEALHSVWRSLADKLLLHRVDFGAGYEPDAPEHGRESAAGYDDANVASSALAGRPGCHAVVLDLDVPAWLVPSTTPGHSHLYADVACPWPDYLEFLRAAARIGLVEQGYVSACEACGYSSVRLPWVAKEAPVEIAL
jgi:hypothetical protein